MYALYADGFTMKPKVIRTMASPREPSLKICQQTMYARSAVPARMNLKFMKDDCQVLFLKTINNT